ncbi:hypothetical protein BTVI_87439 [Pitangus sulphuratus]|nr:hypothetical protein BTVI_87439 [Pitangus sulphuratus]
MIILGQREDLPSPIDAPEQKPSHTPDLRHPLKISILKTKIPKVASYLTSKEIGISHMERPLTEAFKDQESNTGVFALNQIEEDHFPTLLPPALRLTEPLLSSPYNELDYSFPGCLRDMILKIFVLLEHSRGLFHPIADPGKHILKTGYSKLSGVVDMHQGQDEIQRDLVKLKKRTHGKLTRFNEAKCKVLHLVLDNPLYHYRLQDEGIESSPAEKMTWGC